MAISRQQVNDLRDLSEEEENKDRTFFRRVASIAGRNAVRENLYKKIPITFLQDGWIVRRMPSGDIEKVAPFTKDKAGMQNRRFSKGKILHVGNKAS